MEVVAAEEKKKIFRARKTMKISDRQQLESLHNTLLTSPSPPLLLNGTHKDDGQKMSDKDLNNILESKSPQAESPVSPSSRSSPAPFLSLNLSPSSASSQSPKEKEETAASPVSPFHSLNFELKKMEEDEEEEEKNMKEPLSSSSNEAPPAPPTDSNDQQKTDSESSAEKEKKEDTLSTAEGTAEDAVKDSVKNVIPSPVADPVSDYTEPMESDSDTTKAKDPEDLTVTIDDQKPSSPKDITSDSSLSSPNSTHGAPSPAVVMKEEEIKDEDTQDVKDDEDDVEKGSVNVEKMDVDVKVDTKKEEIQAVKPTLSRPSSTPPANTEQEEKCSTSGLKRTLSEGYEKDGHAKRDSKRPKMEGVELEAQLELKITAKASSRHKLEKIVQQLVEERMRMFDKDLQALKDRVDQIDCATKHQSALSSLQSKIARLSKKFGEANQVSENKRKQEALAAVTATAAAAAAKPAATTSSPSAQRPVRTTVEVKQTPSSLSSCSTAASSIPPSTSTSTATVVPQTPILQLISSTSSAASTLPAGITTQSPTGTLVLKTAPGSSMVAAGQPLLIQLPLSMTSGQTGTLVNIPVSSLSAASSLTKAKTTASTTTFILKPAPATTTATVSAPATAVVPALQASTGQVTSTQISVARAVYQGGAGGITTPNAGVSVTSARTPAQSVSVAGAISSASSPATSGPAATGSTAPGPPQGTSLTSKTDNQATGSTSSKVAAPAVRPKGSVIDLTEDDDDVQVTGVQNATIPPPSAPQRPHPVINISNNKEEQSMAFDNDSESGQVEKHLVIGQENTQVTRRFPLLSPTDLEQLEGSAQSKDTTKQTKWGVQLFRQWLVENGKDGHFESLPESSLAESLREFYASARNKDGNLYSKNTYIGIRASINRHLRGAPFHKAVSIVNGEAFHQANSMFSAMLKRLKREGLDTTKHHDPISESDFHKLQVSDVFSTDNPKGLQRKVWFDITLSFARRGRENLRELKSDVFNFKVDGSGRSYVEMRCNEATKNHQGDNLKDDDFESKPRMYAIENSSRCPVQSLKKYLEKRNPANNVFFQKAKAKINTEDEDTWYTTRPVGEKTLHNFMKTISIKAGLRKVYTNHCVKATTITRLAQAKEIMRISGHRNELSICSYNSNSSEEQKRMYSALLHGQENTTFPNQPSSPHTYLFFLK
ncbi:activating transcription factor 7-interacting protein 1 isoform X2 [Thalassophryne amazonica]|uniref:activating transcription factor 7-interacting protein 1 isoform X2 n=1 Tax=Thalassophryne amazonica TaxID=390379 RepID=UPI0014720B9A|nr:activating transcription factor 7-interacting protein 1 isoform X2 [Thalassophryne amazonica]